MTLAEGWYLMSVPELEVELKRVVDPSVAPSGAVQLTSEEALRHRDSGNVPDEQGRSLRLVLHVRSADDVRRLSERRLKFEPDFHEAPTWRREGSVPINIVPLRLAKIEPVDGDAWWREPDVAELEKEWNETGAVSGLRVPSEYRSFVYKTVLSLRKASTPVTVDAIADSVARWLPASDVARLKNALEEANR